MVPAGSVVWLSFPFRLLYFLIFELKTTGLPSHALWLSPQRWLHARCGPLRCFTAERTSSKSSRILRKETPPFRYYYYSPRDIIYQQSNVANSSYRQEKEILYAKRQSETSSTSSRSTHRWKCSQEIIKWFWNMGTEFRRATHDDHK